MQAEVTVVIPNYNGMRYIGNCLDSLLEGTLVPEILVVDNASTDGSMELVRDRYAAESGHVVLLGLRANTGFCHAVNCGLHLARTPYVMLLNNDTTVEAGAVAALLAAIRRRPRAFAVQARMLSMRDPSVIDDAGDLYCALGWAFARGKGEPADGRRFGRPCRIFSACAGAAMYRREVFDRIGYFDERHYCYLEDVDIGWRARLYGCGSYYEPSAVVYHAGSAVSGSAHNPFKERMTAGNNRYLLWKNMPALQFYLNLPLILLGAQIKRLYFGRKGLGEAYEDGLLRGRHLVERARYGDRMRRCGSPERGTLWEEAGVKPEPGVKPAGGVKPKFCNAPAGGMKPESGNVPAGGEEMGETHHGSVQTPLIYPLYLGGKLPLSPLRAVRSVFIQWELFVNTVRRLL